MSTERKTPSQKKDIIRPTDPTAKIRDAKDVYARLFRMIIYEMNMTHERWDQLFNRFLDNTFKGRKVSTRKRGSERGNKNDAFLADKMTGRHFIEAIQFLYPITARMSIHLEFPFANLTKSLLIFSRNKDECDDFSDSFSIDEEAGTTTNTIDIVTGGSVELAGIDSKLYNKLKRIIDEYNGENAVDESDDIGEEK